MPDELMRSIGPHIDILSGFAFNSSLFSDESGTPLIRIRDLLVQKTETYFTGPHDSKYIVHDDDVLIGMDGDFNVVRWQGGKGLLNQRVCKILCISATLDATYLFHWLPIKLLEIHQRTPQTTVRHLSPEAINQITIPFFSLPEQHRIADILDTVDTAIQQTEALIAKLKLMKAGLLHDLLTRGLDEHGRLRDPIAHSEQFKDSPLGRIPREWEPTAIGELGIWRGGSTPSKAVASNWSSGTILWVSPKDIRGAEISDSEDKITERALSESNLSLFNSGDVLVVFRSGILRHTFPVAIGLGPFTVNQDIKVLAVRPGICRRFAFYALQAMGSKVLSLAVKAGTTVESIDYRVFSSLPLMMPPEREQQLIVAILDAHDARLHAEEAYCDKLKQLKKGLMHDLLTGQVRVQAAEAAQ